MWVLAQSIDFFPREMRVAPRSLHIVLGLVLAITVLARLAWRFTGGVKLAPAEAGALGKLAIGVHHLLYLLLVVTLVLGMVTERMRGDNIFGLFRVPAMDVERELRRTVQGYHELAANVLLGLALLHAMAAVWHQRIKKDNVMRRMRPGLPEQP